MAQAATAYNLPALPEQPASQPQLRAIPGRGQQTVAAPVLAPWVKTACVMAAVLIAVLATVCVSRIAISNLTVQLMFRAEQTTELISNAKANGAALEVWHSVATNPNRVQDKAAANGVLPGNAVTTLEARHGFTDDVKFIMTAAATEAVNQEVAAAEAAAAAKAEAAAALQAQEAAAADAAAQAEAATAEPEATTEATTEATSEAAATPTIPNANSE